MLTSLLFMGLAIAAKPDSRFPVVHYHASEGIGQACYAIWFYILKTALPLNLVAFYPSPLDLKSSATLLGLSIAATLAMSTSLFFLRQRWPGLLAAWLCYLVILAPNSGIIRISEQPADRYSYMSMLGLAMLAAVGVSRLWRMSSRWHFGVGIGIVAIGLGPILGLTAIMRDQCRTWRDTEALWAHALTHGANSSFAVHNYLAPSSIARGSTRLPRLI